MVGSTVEYSSMNKDCVVEKKDEIDPLLGILPSDKIICKKKNKFTQDLNIEQVILKYVFKLYYTYDCIYLFFFLKREFSQRDSDIFLFLQY